MIRAAPYRIASLFCALCAAFPQDEAPESPARRLGPANTGKSMLIVVLDDVGSEQLSFMPHSVTPVATPNLSRLAAEGVLYDNFWAAPNCSPARSMLLTGRFTLRTGVGNIVKPRSSFELAQSEITIAEQMQARGYRTGMFGKWHLGHDPESPCNQGFDVWTGSIGNIDSPPPATPGSFYDWERYDDTSASTAVLSQETAYATTVTTDATMSFVTQPGAFFAYVAYNDAHKPWEPPPGYEGPEDNLSLYRAKIQFLDAEVGRLLSVVDLDETTVVVLSDNGAPNSVVVPPNVAGRTKFSVYRGGIELPCIIAGYATRRAISLDQNTPGQVLSGNAHIVDLFRTVLTLQPNIGGPGDLPNNELDSRTLYEPGVGFRDDVRDWVFVERYEPNGAAPNGPYTLLRRAVEQNGYKSVQHNVNPRELYETAVDPWELNDLLADGISPLEQSILDRLDALLLSELGLQ